eukprot:scaffold2784_cov109-Cylindrotheca_fusiformis.AAC.3
MSLCSPQPSPSSELSNRREIMSPAAKTKEVVFDTHVRARRIPPLKSYTPETKKAIWYTRDEAKQLRKDIVETISKIVRNVELGEDDCARGLEFKEPKKQKRRHRRKRFIIGSVLEEQERFYSKMENDDKPLDDELISSIYRFESRNCVREALKIAESDASEAMLAWE